MSDINSQKFLKGKKLKRSAAKEIEPQEVFLDNLARKKEEELDISEKKFEVPLSKEIIRVSFLVFLLFVLIFSAQAFYFQVLKHEKFSLLAQENKIRTFLIRAERGVIYDNSGQQLVFNSPSFDLVCDQRNFPPEVKEKSNLLSQLSRVSGREFNDLKRQIEESDSPQVLIMENLNQEVLIFLETNPIFYGGKESSPCYVEMSTVRDYVLGPDFSHLIGYTGKINKEEIKRATDYSITDYIGKSGLEKSYEKILRGNPGKWKIEKDALGKTKSESLASEPNPGNSLVLWLNSDLQKKITEEISSMLEKSGAKAGIGIALNPKNGGVFSLVSLPTFDNNLFSKGMDIETLQEIFDDPVQPLFNRAISGEYLTGSTIKPLIASAALQEKIISPQKQIYDSGFIEIPHRYDPKEVYRYWDWTPHGWVDLRKAIAVSCNVYFYTIGGGYEDQKGLGVERIKQYLELFGWGQKTGIDLPGEGKGLIPDPAWKKEKIGEDWYTGNTYHLSIGQAYLGATPLQVANAFAAIANGGVLYQPQVVQQIVDIDKNILQELTPKILRQNFIDADNLKIVREGMREAVTYGSSVILNDLPIKTAAKTGTAETSKEGHYHNWVTVFAPYDDPQIVLTIVIEDVKEEMVVALPIAKEVLNWYFTR